MRLGEEEDGKDGKDGEEEEEEEHGKRRKKCKKKKIRKRKGQTKEGRLTVTAGLQHARVVVGSGRRVAVAIVGRRFDLDGVERRRQAVGALHYGRCLEEANREKTHTKHTDPHHVK